MLIQDTELSDLIGDIYQCAIVNSHWHYTLERLCRTFNSTYAEMMQLDGLTGAHVHHVVINNTETQFISTPDMSLNPVTPLVLVQPIGVPFKMIDVISLDQFKRTLFFKRYLIGWDVGDMLIFALAREATRGVYVGLQRGSSKGPYTDEEVALAQLLNPHMCRAVAIAGLIKRGAEAEATLESLIGSVKAIALIVTSEGRLLFSNPAGHAALEAGDMFSVKDSVLSSRRSEIAAMLAKLPTLDRGNRRNIDVMIDGPDGHGVLVSALRLEGMANTAGIDAPILVLMRVPEPNIATPLEVAANVFKLTPMEIQTLAQVMQGNDLAKAAEVIGVKRSTVKSHLDSIYFKAGVGKQTELFGKVMSLMPRVG